jgi:endoglucanase Acf2
LILIGSVFGQGYSTNDPGELNLPPNPNITGNITGPVLTTDWSASLAFNQLTGSNRTSPLVADPLTFICDSYDGLIMGPVGDMWLAGNPGDEIAFVYSHLQDLSVTSINMSGSNPLMDAYSDWSVTASWNSGSFKAVMAHGSPFAYFNSENGIEVNSIEGEPVVWYNNGSVLGITVNGHYYGLFAPSGSQWDETGTGFQSDLNGLDYCSIAFLPNAQSSTIEYYGSFAYNFITDTVVDWEYDLENAQVIATYTAIYDQKESGSSNMLYALYPHQWLNYSGALTDISYVSARGEMKTIEGINFTTEMAYTGILPHLPMAAEDGVLGFNEFQQRMLITAEYNKSDDQLILSDDHTYATGVRMGRTAQLVRIADQLGMIEERDRFLNVIKSKLEDWLTYTTDEGTEYFYYDDRWGTLIGVPAGYGSDSELNDHHFHYGYYIRAAATVAQFDSAWVEMWGAMVELLIRDTNSWLRDDELFTFMRGFDIYAGHSWASGHADFAEGNNQESSSEAINCASGIALWGMVTGNDEIRDLGIYLYTTEKSALQNYWFDINDICFPVTFPKPMVGMVWGMKADYATWFGAAPDHAEFVHGINLLPITAASLHLGHDSEYVLENYNFLDDSYGIDEWEDILWEYLALGDPQLAVDNLISNPNYSPAGSPVNETQAHTYHWIHNLNAMGLVHSDITANTPSYAVFDKNGFKIYVAYNSSETNIDVLFSDGAMMSVPAGELVFLREDTNGINADAGDNMTFSFIYGYDEIVSVDLDASESSFIYGNISSFEWFIGETLVATGINPTVDLQAADAIYEITLMVTGDDSSSDSDQVYITLEGRTSFEPSCVDDFSVLVSSNPADPTIQFVPSNPGVGENLLLLFYHTDLYLFPAGVGANTVAPNEEFHLNDGLYPNIIDEDETVHFYYVYNVPGGGETSNLDCLMSFDASIVETCIGLVGDLNFDNVTDVLDIVMMVECISVQNCHICSDVNGDDDTNILDIISLLNAILEA